MIPQGVGKINVEYVLSDKWTLSIYNLFIRLCVVRKIFPWQYVFVEWRMLTYLEKLRGILVSDLSVCPKRFK